MSREFNVAHVQDVSGTFVAPAHSAYDRQVLREHVARRGGRVSALTLGGTRWLITRLPAGDARCVSCTHLLGRLSYSRVDDDAATCFDCALNQPQHTMWKGTENANG